MSDEMMNHGHSGHETEFEREDLSTRGIFAFMIGLAVVGVVIYFIINGMYSFLDKYERSQMAPGSPLVTPGGVTSRYIPYAPGQGDYVDKTFQDNGAPLLETNERGQFRDFLLNQEDQLNSYGWVDKKDGVAHIPIERAMELIVQHGLPVYPQGNAEAGKTASKMPAQKSEAK